MLESERKSVRLQLSGYKFADPDKSLESLVPELGGTPQTALVVTTWRSGSTFLGDVLLSHPATYYHYEPLLHLLIQQVRAGRDAQRAVQHIKELIRCDYSEMGRPNRGVKWGKIIVGRIFRLIPCLRAAAP